MNTKCFDEVFDKAVKEHNIPFGHVYSRESLKELCLQIACELEKAEVKNAEEGMKKMGFTPEEITVLKQEDNCKVCPDQCGAFAKSTDATQHKRQNFLKEYPRGCRCEWDLRHVGEGMGDWEGIYRSEDRPPFGNNMRELITAVKLWWDSIENKLWEVLRN